MTTLEEAMAEFKPRSNSKVGQAIAASGVTQSEEFKRIEALPRRTNIPDYTVKLTAAYKRKNGVEMLRLLQAEALVEAWHSGGLFAPMPVGSGKTLVSLLAASLFQAKRPLLLVPANLLHKTQKVDYPAIRKNWRIHPYQSFLSHEKLGTEKNADILFKLMPDLIVIDEAHGFKNMKAARTKRLLRYLDAARAANKFPVRLIILSGSITRNSLRDYWHLIIRALPKGCPLPMQWRLMDEWACALDADSQKYVAPGALMRFCDPSKEPVDLAPTTRARMGFRRRLVETPGVVATTGSGFGEEEEPGIEIHEVIPKEAPDIVKKAFYDLRMFGNTPSGELVTDAMSIWRHSNELALGFYSRWVWPGFGNLKPGEPDTQWLEARRDWHGVLREVLKNGGRYKTPLDSNFQVFNAFENGDLSHPAFNTWYELKDRYQATGGTPPTEIVWLTDWLVKDAANQAKKLGKGTIAWVSRPAFGEALAKLLKVPYFGAGNEEIITYTGGCVASVNAHGTGKNLQHFHKNLLVGSLHGASRWQQWMGRTHRPGQKQDTVLFHLYMHAKELRTAFDKAMEESKYVRQTVGDVQKLLQATTVRRSDNEIMMVAQKDPLWSIEGYTKKDSSK